MVDMGGAASHPRPPGPFLPHPVTALHGRGSAKVSRDHISKLTKGFIAI